MILIGGFFSNAIWCVVLLVRNQTWRDYTRTTKDWYANVGLSLASGVIWFGQFFFYGMGTTKLGKEYDFSSWSIHMAFIILFSSVWGLIFREWRGTSSATMAWVYSGLLALLGCTVVIGLGNSLAG